MSLDKMPVPSFLVIPLFIKLDSTVLSKNQSKV